MRQFIKRFFLFFGYSIILYLLMIILWGDFAPQRLNKNLKYKLGSIGQMQLRLEEMNQIDELDILFIGSSAAYRGFDIRIFDTSGLETFNLGSSAQTPIQTTYLLNKYLPKIELKLLVIDVNPLMFSIDGVESSLDLITNDDFNPGLLKMALEVNNLQVYNTLLYGLYADLFKRNSEYQTEYQRIKDTYIKGGFVEHELSFFRKIPYEDRNWNFSEKQFAVFEEIILFLKASKVNYIIVQTPITPELYFAHRNNETFDTFMSSQGQYFNFNTILNMNDSLHFIDAYHLNQYGIEIYNRELIQILQSDTINLINNRN